MRLLNASVLVCLLHAAMVAGAASEDVSEQGFMSYFVGRREDVTPPTQPGLLLVGGGDDRQDAMRWFVDRGGQGNILVLRVSGSDGYNSWLLEMGAASVQSIVFSSKVGANSPIVVEAVQKAEAIFFAGGDQSRYVGFLEGSLVLNEVQKAVQRGVPIGGTSAGLAILGDYIFAAFGTSVTSREALSNPYSNNVTLVRSFLSLPFMRRVITDSHFKRRDRMGRLLTFMARIIHDGWDTSPLGIGIDEGAALGIDDAGTASVFADEEAVYFLNATAAPSVCASRQPLSFANIHLQKLNKGDVFDVTSWTKTSGLDYTVSVLKGRIESSQGSIY